MSFQHTHSEESYDEYKTDDGFHRITVRYENGSFKELQVRAYESLLEDEEHPNVGRYQDIIYSRVDEINELITALHAAIAGINKKGPQDHEPRN